MDALRIEYKPSERAPRPLGPIHLLEVHHEVRRQEVARPLPLHLILEITYGDRDVLVLHSRREGLDGRRHLVDGLRDIRRRDDVAAILRECLFIRQKDLTVNLRAELRGVPTATTASAQSQQSLRPP